MSVPVDEIISPEQFMGKEHFVSYRDAYTPEYGVVVPAGLFYVATSPESDIPTEYIKDRELVGLGLLEERYWPPERHLYKKAKLAVQAGALIDFALGLELPPAIYPNGIGPKTREFAQRMVNFLQGRFQE
jgi:hypothetical protein